MPYLAIGFFCPVFRSSELEKLTWDNIDLAAEADSGDGGFIQDQPNSIRFKYPKT